MTVSSPTSSSQNWSAADYAANAHFVPALGQPVLDLLHPRAGERILDLGCGDGVLTEKLVALGAHVVGIDSSADMIAAARRRGLDAKVMDARALTFENEFDAVFSNAALHWVKDDPDSPIAGAFRALAPGGRFVGELGGHGCVGAIIVALHWKRIPSDEDNKVFGHVQAFVAGSPLNMQVMVKDSTKYATSGGWGFADFTDGKPSDEAKHKTCFPCHEPAKAHDFVYTQYAP